MSGVYNVTVFTRGDMIYVKGYDKHNKRHRKSSGKKHTKANLAWVQKHSHDVLLQLISDTSIIDKGHSLNFKEYAFKTLEMNSMYRKKATNTEYLATLKRDIIPYFGGWEIPDITASSLKQWQGKLLKRIGGRTLNDVRSIFRGILQEAYFDEIIDNNPFDRVKRAKVDKTEIFPFSWEEVQSILKKCDGWFKNYLIVAFFTGLRSGEMIGLQWKDIDFTDSIISVRRNIRKNIIETPKTSNSFRDIDMLSVVKNALIAQKKFTKDSDYIFVNQYGNHYSSTEKITKYKWKPLLEKCKLEYRILYRTRHSFASIMLQQGEEVAWISKMLGHADIHTTLTKYARYIPRKDIERAKFLSDFEVV